MLLNKKDNLVEYVVIVCLLSSLVFLSCLLVEVQCKFCVSSFHFDKQYMMKLKPC